MLPSESDEPEPVKLTTSGLAPETGVAVATAVGATFAATAVTTVLISVAPKSSVTVSVAVNEPAEV
jgi:hypothetical protein